MAEAIRLRGFQVGRRLCRVGTALLLGMGLAILAVPLWSKHPAPDTMAVAGDLVTYLAGARLVVSDPSALYNPNAQFVAEQALVSDCCPHYRELFLSPPFVALAYVPLAWLGLSLAQLVWLGVSVGLLLASLVLLRPLVPGLKGHGQAESALFFLGSWPVVELLVLRQNSAVALFVLVVGLRLLLARRDALAGVALAVGLFKPQIFLFVPVLLLVQRRRLAFLSWLAVAAGLVGISLFLVGPSGLRAYISLITSPDTADLMQQRSWQMISLPALARHVLDARSITLPSVAAYSIGLALLIGFGRLARRPAASDHQFALLFACAVAAGLLASPYIYDYDAVVLLIPALLAPGQLGMSAIVSAGYGLAWTAPFRNVAFGSRSLLALPILPIVVVVYLVQLARELAEIRSQHEKARDEACGRVRVT